MGEKAQINLQVDSDQKDEWKDYIEESGRYSSLTGLIRAAVESEINGDPNESQTAPPAMSQNIETIKSELDRVRKDVAWLREQRQDAADISELAQEVFDSLKPLPDVSAADVDAAQQEVAGVTGVQEYGPQTVQALANQLATEPSRIEDALEYLEDQFMPVEEVVVEGQRHYFKEAD